VEAAPYLEYEGKVIDLKDLAQSYVFSTVSLLEQTQHVYVYIEDGDRDATAGQFSFIKGEFLDLFNENEFVDVQFHYMTEKILFNRALGLDRASIDVLTESDLLLLVEVKTSFVSQQSVDFFFTNAHILLQVIDTNGPDISFREEVLKRGAGRTRALSAVQAVENAVNELLPQLNLFLKETRRLYGV
jgi:hypothetical protein